MSEDTSLTNKQKYLQEVLDKYKKDPQDESLSQAEKILLNQAFSKEERVADLLKQSENLKQQLKSLEQQVVFERGQITGIVDSLLALQEE